MVRTIFYVGVASVLSLLIGYPAAYFVARFAGRRKGLFLILLIAPFWISFMMRKKIHRHDSAARQLPLISENAAPGRARGEQHAGVEITIRSRRSR